MTGSLVAYWRSMADGKSDRFQEKVASWVLFPFSLPYQLMQNLRAFLYRRGMLPTAKLSRPVISIGNITVGGTGKTPMTALIARLLIARGLRVAVLSRGYGGSMEGQTAIVSDGNKIFFSALECGDEPFLLARSIPGLMVVIGSDRYKSGLLAIESLDPDLFLLDDGFQHIRLHRDLNILLLDATRPFGNGRLLPAGLLRETKKGAERADLLIFTRCANDTKTVSDVSDGKPYCTARHAIRRVVSLDRSDFFDINELSQCRLLAFAGIANPDDFFDRLKSAGLLPANTISFSDHVIYDAEKVSRIMDLGKHSGAEYLITTEKDAVKLLDLPEEVAKNVRVALLEIDINNEELLLGAIHNVLQKYPTI